MEEIGLVGVLVLIYIHNVLIVGRSRARVREQAVRAVQALCPAGGVISPIYIYIRAPWSRLRAWCGLGKTWTWVGEAYGRPRMRGRPYWPIGCVCPLASVVCGVCSSFWGAHSGSAGLVLGIVLT